jgi:hypothetical protein
MKIQAKIIQLIKWEDRKKYFFSVDWKEDGEYDLLHCNITRKISTRELLIGFVASLMNKSYGKNFSQDGFIFGSAKGFPIWVKRSHEFKEGDLVEIEITIKAIMMNQTQNNQKVELC